MDNRPIGVFDSGIGGLTAVKELMRLLPNEDIIYFGDTGRVPYGTRSRETIQTYTRQDIGFLKKQGVKFAVAACGTVSTNLPEHFEEELGIPFTGVLQPAAMAAIRQSKNGRIGVIGTGATIGSGAFPRLMKEVLPQAEIFCRSCPLFVPLVENGFVEPDNEITRLTTQLYISPFLEEKIDTLIMGCTHYPVLRSHIAAVMGEDVALIDPGAETAHFVKNYLLENHMEKGDGTPGTQRYFVSDSIENFSSIAEIFLEASLQGQVAKVSVDEY